MEKSTTRLCCVMLVFIISCFILLSLDYSVLLGEKYVVGILDEPETDFCSGRYVYVHDLPRKFNDDIIKDCKSLIKWFDMCPYMVNYGFGQRLVNDKNLTNGGITDLLPYGKKSWFDTNQFLLEVIFREKLKRYKCLTHNSSMASVIFVPFYAGFDVSRYLWAGNISVRDRLSNELTVWLRGQPEWNRMSGRDHFMVVGRIMWDFLRQTDDESDWGNTLLKLPAVKNMTVLSIEKSYWSNGFAVPYPTYFHPTTRDEVVEVAKKSREQKTTALVHVRGGPRADKNESIRGEIIEQCLASGTKCNLLDCSPPRKTCDHPLEVMEAFRDSVFCLQPPGDSSTRKSIFDSILAGCIPVFFHPMSAYGQYTWYFPKDYLTYSVFLPEDVVKVGKIDIGDALSRINKRRVSSMRDEVVRLIPKIVYARWDTESSEKLEDAVDIAIDRVIERVEKVRKKIKDGKDPAVGFAEWMG